MGGEWANVPLGDLVLNFDSKRVPLSSREREERRGRFPYYGATGVMDYVDAFLFEGLHLLVAEDGSVERPDGMPFVQLVDGQFWVNNHAHVLRAQTDEDTKFLYYALQTVPIRPFMSGSVQAKLSQANLNRIPIPYPTDEAERRSIAHILGTLDDKIELNRRMSETLEAMARALFKSWFVDFDPVRAKMEGCWRCGDSLPGLPAHLYDLFPDWLVDSELGEIPEGWGVKKLGDVLELAYGKALKDADRQPGTVPVYGSNGQVGWHNERLAKGPGIIIGRKGNPGTVNWASTDFFAIDTTFYVRPKGECQSLYFLFYALRTHDLPSLAADSAVPGLNRNFVYANLQLIPPPGVLQAFDRLVKPLFDRQYCNDLESRTLAQLRDTLLPKLISGELRVKDAERFLKERGL
jgi:type I restriction enzyme S subunit